MASWVLRRRAVTAAALYGGTAAGILGTLIAVRVLGPSQFGLLSLALATAGFVQLLLDTTVEEAMVKYGFRYAATEDWARLRSLFRTGLLVKWGGGAAATVIILLLVPFTDAIFGQPELKWPLFVAAFIPIAQAPEGIAGASLIIAGRYDLRALAGGIAMTLRLVGIAIGVQYGVTWAVVGILLGQIAGSCVSGYMGRLAFRRHPAAVAVGLRRDRGEIGRFVLQSGIGTSLVSMRNTLTPLALGIVAPIAQVGYFRAAQAPITGFEALSAPVRLILLTEQTRDVEAGRIAETYRSLRRYVLGASGVALVIAPFAWILMPWLVRVVLGEPYIPATDAARILLLAACGRLVLGWTKSFPVSIGKPGLRIVAHSVEIVTLLPLVILLGAEWGATGGAVAVLIATVAFGLAWWVLLLRLRREHRATGLIDEEILAR
jgi:O-antigen/teichoic acid export membrane protein